MRVLSVSAEALHNERAIEEAASALRAGRIVVFPTETVYGLGALATSRDAVKRVFEVKGRPASHPLIVHVRDQTDAMLYASAWPTLARELANAFWPGPLTLVVPKSDRVPSEVTGGGSAVALRAPSHPVARALLDALGEAIVAPSANRYQSISPTRAEHVLTSLGPDLDLLVLDAGPCPSGIESTVVDVREGTARVLRPGALSIPTLRAVAPSLQFAHIEIGDDAARASPGQGARHYAPTTSLVIARDRADALANARALEEAGERAAVILFEESIRREEREHGAVHVLPRGAEAAGAALYALLYELDRQKYARIFVEPPPREPGWEAIEDRLRRAAR